MKVNRETIVGIALTIFVFGVIAAVTGVYGIIYIGLAFIIVIVSINLFTRNSAAAKAGAVILNTDLIYKILMPRRHKKAIRALKEKESDEKT